MPCLNPVECGLRPGGSHRANTAAAQKCLDRTVRQNASRSAAKIALAPVLDTSVAELRRFEKRANETLRALTDLKGKFAATAAEVVRDLARVSPELADALNDRSYATNSGQVATMKIIGELVGEPYRASTYSRHTTPSATRISELLIERATGEVGRWTDNAQTPESDEDYVAPGPAPRVRRDLIGLDAVAPAAASGVCGDFMDYIGLEATSEDDPYFTDLLDRDQRMSDLCDLGFDSAHAEGFLHLLAEDLRVTLDDSARFEVGQSSMGRLQHALEARRASVRYR